LSHKVGKLSETDPYNAASPWAEPVTDFGPL